MKNSSELERIDLHWDGQDDLLGKHLIDADTLSSSISALQNIVCLVAMDNEGYDVSSKMQIPPAYYRRFAVCLGVPASGGYIIPVQIGAREDLTSKGQLPEVMRKVESVLGLVAGKAKGGIESFSRLIRNVMIRRRVVVEFGTLLPKVGSNRKVIFQRPGSEAITLDEKHRHGLSDLSKSAVDATENALESMRSTITGRLARMDFDKREITIYYPPTKKMLKCSYLEDFEPTLLENPRGFIQVRGLMAMDGDVLEKVTEVDSILDLDISPIEIERVPIGTGQFLVLKHLLSLSITSSDGGWQMLEVEDEQCGVNVFAATRDELIEAIYEDVEVIWRNYVIGGEKLTDEANEIAKWWRENAELREEGAK